MALFSTLASLSQTAASNAADGSVDAPATIDNQLNLLASFIAQLRDANGFTTGIGYAGQCRLTKSGSNLLLSRFNGSGLTINGITYSIPSGGVSLAPTSLTPGTNYYIYAYMNAGTMTLEASTTTHATDTTTGIEIKSGDSTRTLVGMGRPITGPAWQDTSSQRLVISWFNRQPINFGGVYAANQTNASTSFAEPSMSIRAEFLSWAAICDVSINGWTSNNTAGQGTFTVASFDGVLTDDASLWISPVGGALGPVFSHAKVLLTEGNHYATLLSQTTGGGTSSYPGSGTANNRMTLYGTTQG